MCVAPREDFGGKPVTGVFGQAPDSIIEGLEGFEAGLAAFGDSHAWVGRLVSEPLASLDRKAADFLVEKGTDSALGARPLRRVVQEYVEDPLADLVLAGKAKPRLRGRLAKDGKTIKF